MPQYPTDILGDVITITLLALQVREAAERDEDPPPAADHTTATRD